MPTGIYQRLHTPWNKKTREEKLKTRRDYYKKNKEKINQQTAPGLRRRVYREKYNLEPEQYDLMLSNQNGVCAICKKPPIKTRLCVDHCHKTGKVRKLLCHTCNLGLGNFKDNQDLLKNAFDYLSQFNTEE